MSLTLRNIKTFIPKIDKVFDTLQVISHKDKKPIYIWQLSKSQQIKGSGTLNPDISTTSRLLCYCLYCNVQGDVVWWLLSPKPPDYIEYFDAQYTKGEYCYGKSRLVFTSAIAFSL